MHFEEGQTVGIDLGTTYSTLAQLDRDGNPVAIPNEDDEVETASLILLTDTKHVIVGPNRTRASVEDPKNVVERIKRHMGENEYKRTFDGRPITPEFLSALILKKLRQDAQKRIGKIANAVITVPYYFNDARRKATQDAGRIAGFNVIDIINEPTAATLTYAWHRGELGAGTAGGRARKALVYDLGGGTFDVTVVQYTPAHFQVLATDGDVQLGGVDWNDRLLDHVAEEFKTRHGLDPRESASTVQVLRNDCDLAKMELSEKQETAITCRHAGKAITVRLTRAQFESMTADLLQRTSDTTALVLQQAGITAKQLDAVVLVGGSTLMPCVPAMMENLLGVKPYRGLSPYTAVAQGAAIHAAILEAKFRGGSEISEKIRKMLAAVKQENVNSHGLGIVATNPKSGRAINHVMIPRNTRLPIQVSQVFKTNRDGQERIAVQVLEGDAPDPNACSLLGKCRVTDLPPDLPKGSPVEVTYAFDASGRIGVTARDKTGGKEAAISIQRRGGLNENQVDAYSKLASEYQVD
ncbi:MAG: Hsp70 family protein [Pirellulales bacterium]|nr:Hsp70 family protein [Pirellulales bacterium]